MRDSTRLDGRGASLLASGPPTARDAAQSYLRSGWKPIPVGFTDLAGFGSAVE
jgi:hypothetical protein